MYEYNIEVIFFLWILYLYKTIKLILFLENKL